MPHWRDKTPKERQDILKAGALVRMKRTEIMFAQINHPRRLLAWWLWKAGNCRAAMTTDSHPGRYWWRRNHDNLMRKVKELQNG